jgi:predicted AAA+ superfamily ATPase
VTDKVRLLENVLRERLCGPAQTAFVSGPRQVGKTTPCRALATAYLDWSSLPDRRLILRGPVAVAEHLGLSRARERDTVVVFDNLHAYRKWKKFLRAVRSRHGPRLRVIVTGLEPARTNASPARNCCRLRMHPWTVGEWVRNGAIDSLVQPPAAISDEDWAALTEHGGFPEPFLKRDPRFTRSWQARRQEELLANDLFELAAVHDPAIVRMLALLLSERSASPLCYSHLSRELSVSVDTVRRWVQLLVRAQFGFLVRPWCAGVPKALRKEPKWFLRDWSGVATPAERRLTLVACHLLKAVEGWTDLGFGRFELRYLRDKRKREVDFLVVRDRKPWFLVALGSDAGIAPALGYFQERTRARYAFHVVFDGPYVAVDCFERAAPVAVPARTLLSQLL